MEIYPLQISLVEHIVKEGNYGVVTIGIVPVVLIANDDAQLSFQVQVIQVIVHTIANELPVFRLNAKVVGAGCGIA